VVGGVQISYIGKDNITQKHVLKSAPSATNKLVVDYLVKLIKGKSKSTALWTYTAENGKESTVTAALLNKFLSEMGSPSTAHKFRHVIGTKTATEGFAKAPKTFKDDASAIEYFKKIMMNVGKVLGHQSGEKIAWSTAKDNYCSPTLMTDFFKSRGFKVPDFLHKKFHSETSSDL
jgi:hypothetical protein